MDGMENGPEKLGVLWRKTSKKGTPYFSSVIGEQHIIVFAVRQKRSPKSPDFEVYRSERREKQQAFHGEDQEPW